MPEIPTFVSTQSLQTPAQGGQIPISAGAAVGNALAEGFDRVSAQFARVAEQANRQAAAVEAARITGEVEMQAAELAQKFADDPDPSTSPQRFRQELTALHTKATGNIQNPLVMGAVQERLARSMPVAYVHMLTRAANTQRDMARAAGMDEISRHSLALANAGTEADRELALDGITAAAGRMAGTGAITRDGARNAASKARAEAVLSIATRDPIAANALYERFRDGGLLDSTHALQIQNSLKHPLEVREGKIAAQSELAGSGSGGNDAAALIGAARELGIDPVDLATLMSYETGGKMSPSIRGGKNNQHIGLIQFGAAEQQTYGANERQSFQEQLVAVKAYLRDRGVRPGDDLLTLYRIVNGGNRNVPVTASDGNGTIEQHVGRMAGQHRENAQRFLAGADGGQTRVGPRSQEEVAAGEARLRERLAGRPEVLSAALSEYHQTINAQNAQYRVEQEAIKREYANVQAALEAGIETTAIPEDRIRAAFPKEVADPMVRNLEISRTAGQAFKAIEFGSPEDIRAALGRMNEGETGDPSEDFVHRRAVAQKFGQLVAARDAALKKDPAAYVQNSPVMQSMAAGLNEPGGMQRYLDASLAEQERLGVPRSARRALPESAVVDLVQKVVGTPPEQASMAETLRGIAQQYGDHWPRVFGEMVERGKLPAAYQVLASMTEPGQRVAADQLQRGLALMSEKGGMQALRDGLPDGAARQIDLALDSELAEFRRVSAHSSGGIRLFQAVEGAAKVLAYYAAMRGESPGTAAQAAVQGILRERWEFSGTAMYPKGKGPEVLAATGAVAASLTPDILAPSPETVGTLGMAQEARQAAWVAAAKRGDWVPNKDSTGLVLMAPLENGARIPVKMADGSPVEVRFDALPAVGRGARITPDNRPAAPVQRGMMDMPTFDLQPPRMQ